MRSIVVTGLPVTLRMKWGGRSARVAPSITLIASPKSAHTPVDIFSDPVKFDSCIHKSLRRIIKGDRIGSSNPIQMGTKGAGNMIDRSIRAVFVPLICDCVRIADLSVRLKANARGSA